MSTTPYPNWDRDKWLDEIAKMCKEDEFPLANIYPITGTNDAGARAKGKWWSPYSS